jgi:hypothetical protein
MDGTFLLYVFGAAAIIGGTLALIAYKMSK